MAMLGPDSVLEARTDMTLGRALARKAGREARWGRGLHRREPRFDCMAIPIQSTAFVANFDYGSRVHAVLPEHRGWCTER